MGIKVLLLNIDSKLPNIALKKIERWHEQQGDEVTWDMPMMLNQTDKAYASCIFTRNAKVVANYKGLYPELIAGGTGYDLTRKLPPEIEDIKLRINLGFTTRGCPRHCPFCLVPEAEGGIKVIGDINDLWDGRSKSITLLDNNILAAPEHFIKICRQVRDKNLVVDFNQGLDIRLITRELAECLGSIKTFDVRFAFDFPGMEAVIRQKIKMLRTVKKFQNKHFFFYVLVGFNTTFEQDLHRLDVLRELRCRPYVMRHEDTPKEQRYIELARWVNQMWTFSTFDFGEFSKLGD